MSIFIYICTHICTTISVLSSAKTPFQMVTFQQIIQSTVKKTNKIWVYYLVCLLWVAVSEDSVSVEKKQPSCWSVF